MSPVLWRQRQQRRPVRPCGRGASLRSRPSARGGMPRPRSCGRRAPWSPRLGVRGGRSSPTLCVRGDRSSPKLGVRGRRSSPMFGVPSGRWRPMRGVRGARRPTGHDGPHPLCPWRCVGPGGRWRPSRWRRPRRWSLRRGGCDAPPSHRRAGRWWRSVDRRRAGPAPSALRRSVSPARRGRPPAGSPFPPGRRRDGRVTSRNPRSTGPARAPRRPRPRPRMGANRRGNRPDRRPAGPGQPACQRALCLVRVRPWQSVRARWTSPRPSRPTHKRRARARTVRRGSRRHGW